MARKDNGSVSIYFEHKAGTDHVERGTRGDLDNTRHHRGCKGRWQGSVTIKRERVSSSVSKDDLIAKAEAKQDEAARRLEIDTELTVAQALANLLERLEMDDAAPKTIEARKADVKLLTAEIGPWKLHELTARRVREAFDAIARTHSTESMRKIKSTLSQAIRLVQEDDKLERNVAAIVRAPKGKVDGRKHEAYTAEMVAAILEAALGYRNMDAACNLGFGRGLRPDELRGLHWTELDLTPGKGAVYITKAARHSGRTKGESEESSGSRRGLGLSDTIVEALERQKRMQAEDRLRAGESWHDTGLVFTTLDGRQVDQRYFRKAYRAVLKKAGVAVTGKHGNNRAPYDMRHTFASLGAYAGIFNDQMAAMMGHKRTSTFELVYKDELRPVIQDGQDVLDNVLSAVRSASS